MALIDRYSCELESTMREVTKEMDHIRIEKLNHIKKKAVRIKIDQMHKMLSNCVGTGCVPH